VERKKSLNKKEHKDRPDLAGEHKLSDLYQIILLIVFLAVWITDSFLFHYSDFPLKYIPLYVRLPLGIITLIISGYLAKSGLKLVFGDVRDEPCIINKGIFAVVRHPVYLGSILLYLGLLILTLSVAAAAIWIIILAFYHFISKYEEKLLTEKYGDEYRKYMKEVPMWLPRIKAT
jgi:protein-S-isoprenylcysteine O-methyltransferase Ste14